MNWIFRQTSSHPRRLAVRLTTASWDDGEVLRLTFRSFIAVLIVRSPVRRSPSHSLAIIPSRLLKHLCTLLGERNRFEHKVKDKLFARCHRVKIPYWDGCYVCCVYAVECIKFSSAPARAPSREGILRRVNWEIINFVSSSLYTPAFLRLRLYNCRITRYKYETFLAGRNFILE